MKTRPDALALALVLRWGVLALVAAGCASNREPAVDVRVTRNPMAPQREEKTYAISCSDALVRQWLTADRTALLALDAALEKLGYEEAPEGMAPTHVIVAELGFAQRPEVAPPDNPDSIRYQNVAAMVGGGRYTQILTERNSSGGSLLMGPNGQIIPTGGWKDMIEDSEMKESRTPGTHDTLVLRAWDVSDPSAGAIPVWEVVVERAMDYRRPSPQHVAIMVRQAAEQL